MTVGLLAWVNDMTPAHVSQPIMTKLTRKSRTTCTVCERPLPPPIRGSGRPREICSPTCYLAYRRVIDRRHRARAKSGEGAIAPWRRGPVERTPLPVPQPFSWWVAQAEAVEGVCAKCEGPLVGVYVPPTRATVNECAVVAHCRVCGGERLVLAGCAGVPYDQKGEI